MTPKHSIAGIRNIHATETINLYIIDSVSVAASQGQDKMRFPSVAACSFSRSHSLFQLQQMVNRKSLSAVGDIRVRARA